VQTTTRIEFLFWAGCPSHPEALALLREVIDELDLNVEVELREVETDDEAQALGFAGSPTIRVDVRDSDPAGGGARPAMTCRGYRLPDGRVAPVPTRREIEEALR